MFYLLNSIKHIKGIMKLGYIDRVQKRNLTLKFFI